ncbi:LLM class flavin-dependent oxidoreductase [Rhizomonospora bruguierae]|uniref:LLM class flavin-dependent oxidoreductase n=1 Tax=Rhizomonospora bruguierae TaxID=1581705 RepID=UPI001BCE162B|nr:LLM class flavin-dependent oxidoreductase [Micromonospora sp. NBRC 107566]
MKFALSVPPTAAPTDLVDLAVAADRAGWDGFFVWDHIHLEDGLPLHDPWVLLGAIATATRQVRLGALVTPLARRRPWKVAKEIVTADHLSGGRLIVGVGLGWPASEFTAFGEPGGDRERGDTLDEALEVLEGLLHGGPVEHEGQRFRVRTRISPGPVQAPRPPIWVAATWPHRRPLDRAARYDGVYALGRDTAGGLTLEQIATVRARIGPDADLVVPLEPPLTPREYAEAGATWLISGPDAADLSTPGALDRFREVVTAGPPR